LHVTHIAERGGHAALCRDVWLRVGKTLMTQAVRKPDAAMPRTARIPAPTITTSKLCSTIS
jgi:hypothetical protein